MDIVNAFIGGGLLCLAGQIVFVNTNLGFVKVFMLCLAAGATMAAVGIMGPIVGFGGAGIMMSVLDAGEVMYIGFLKILHGEGPIFLLRFAILVAGVFISGIIAGLVCKTTK